MANNINTITGTIYSKEVKTYPNKKPGEPDYVFCDIKIEYEANINGRSLTPISVFSFGYGVDFEQYSTGDHVTIDYYPVGKDIKTKAGGKFWKEEKKIVYIKYSDMQSAPPQKADRNGKIHVPAMSDINTIADPPKSNDDPFKEKRPSEPVVDDYDDQLPF